MKKPLRTDPITIHTSVLRPNLFKAKCDEVKLTATSVGSPDFAAESLALRAFFGGKTIREGVTHVEKDAVKVVRLSNSKFIAGLKPGVYP